LSSFEETENSRESYMLVETLAYGDELMLITRQAYDSHCNLVLGEVEETIYTVDEDDDDDELKVCRNSSAKFTMSDRNIDYQPEIRDAVCER
jgi:hypothetical protein